MKDVVSCVMPRIGANNLRPGDFRMGQPDTGNAVSSLPEYIGQWKRTEETETSKYLQEKKTIVISRVAASETEIA